jgi:hypothetical protein
MTEKFDPALPDKHAQNPKQHIRRDKWADCTRFATRPLEKSTTAEKAGLRSRAC